MVLVCEYAFMGMHLLAYDHESNVLLLLVKNAV